MTKITESNVEELAIEIWTQGMAIKKQEPHIIGTLPTGRYLQSYPQNSTNIDKMSIVAILTNYYDFLYSIISILEGKWQKLGFYFHF